MQLSDLSELRGRKGDLQRQIKAAEKQVQVRMSDMNDYVINIGEGHAKAGAGAPAPRIILTPAS